MYFAFTPFFAISIKLTDLTKKLKLISQCFCTFLNLFDLSNTFVIHVDCNWWKAFSIFYVNFLKNLKLNFRFLLFQRLSTIFIRYQLLKFNHFLQEYYDIFQSNDLYLFLYRELPLPFSWHYLKT